MINAAVNTNIDTPNSRAAMAMTQDQNLVKIIGGVNRAIEARGGDVKSASAKAMVDKAIMLYNQKSAKVTNMAEGGDTMSATTTPDEVTTTTVKTPEELAAEARKAEEDRVGALQKTAITGQQNLVANVSSDPSKIVTQPTVATVDPDAAGRTIDPTTGQITAPVPQVGQPDFFKQIQQPTRVDPVTGAVSLASSAQRLNPKSAAIVEIYGFDSMPPDLDNLSPDEKTKLEEVTARITKEYLENPQTSDIMRPGGVGLYPALTPPSGVATATTAATPDAVTSETVDAKTASGEVTTALADVDPVTGVVSDAAKVTAATMDPATTGIKDLTAAQGEAVVMTNPVQREIQDGELISGVADATKAAAFTEQVQAATATPSEKATVQGQLSALMADFEGGETPAWAAGAMRAATAAMAARGLGASSMAGQAIIQATMESALPIAMADAQTTAGFEMQNLSNRQQRAMLAAQQRATFMGQEFDQAFQARVSNAAKISDVANMNFTAEQQVALENSRNANTVNLANLTNKQAMVLSEASAISQLESQNLSNQQQAAVQNANSFLQVDMANMNNEQQTTMFKAQSVVQSLLTDQAAENAARQFNASSENQTKQFMANLTTQANQFNAAQETAISQFNAGEENAVDKFNASMEEQRNQFNAQNGLVVAQANAQWRQNVDTLNTAAQNEANMINAATINTFTKAAVDQIWQRERDLMDYAFKGSEQEKDRMVNIMLGEKQIDQYKTQSEQQMKSNEDTAKYSILTQLILKI